MKLKVVNTIVWPAIAHIPQQGGGTVPEEFFVKLNVMSPEEYADKAAQGDEVAFKAIVSGLGETEDKIDTNAELITDAFKSAPYRAAIFSAQREISSGEEFTQAELKN